MYISKHSLQSVSVSESRQKRRAVAIYQAMELMEHGDSVDLMCRTWDRSSLSETVALWIFQGDKTLRCCEFRGFSKASC